MITRVNFGGRTLSNVKIYAAFTAVAETPILMHGQHHGFNTRVKIDSASYSTSIDTPMSP